MEVPEARPLTTSPLAPPSSSAHGLLKLPHDSSEITEVNPWALATSVGSLFSYHTQVGTTPLFVTPPTWSQINQQQLGNCWFLASISAILCLPDGPMRIYHMMREDPTHVIVRLYDNKRLPRYIRLSKSVIYSLSGSEYHAKLDPKTGTWPVFLEKALTAFDRERNFAPKSAYYGRTAGGLGTDGLALLLGVDTMEYPIVPPVMEQVVAHDKPLEQQFVYCLMMLFSGGFSPVLPAHLTVLQSIFGAPNVAQSWADWLAWLNLIKPRDLAEELLEAVAQRQGQKRTVWKRGTILDTKLSFDAGVFRLEHFMLWFDQRNGRLDPGLRQAVLNYVRRSGVLAGKRGTGIYSHSQLQTFHYMLGLHNSHKPMTAGTRSYLGKTESLSKNESKYQYTDESVKGLISLHEYTVSDVYTLGDFCFIRLINPWGNTGRSTILVPRTPGQALGGQSAPVMETGQAEFDLELDDFTKRFRAVYHTVQPLRPADQ